jgi:hypothetical protein
VKTPNDPTTIASACEIIAGVDEPTTTSQTLAAWILAKDYERLKAELLSVCHLALRFIDDGTDGDNLDPAVIARQQIVAAINRHKGATP